MSEMTQEQMSRGMFAIARTVLTLEPAVEEAEASRDAALQERDALREEVRQLLTLKAATETHLEELDARIEDARSELPKALLALQARLLSVQEDVSALEAKAKSLQYVIAHELPYEKERLTAEKRQLQAEVATWQQQVRKLG